MSKPKTRYLPATGFSLGYKERKCLKCQADFNSSGPGNRICPACTNANRACKSRIIPPKSGYGRKVIEEP